MTAAEDLRACLADLMKLREQARRLSYRASVSWRAEIRAKEQMRTTRRELARLERVADGMLARMREEMAA